MKVCKTKDSEISCSYVALLIIIMSLWSFNPLCLNILVKPVGTSWLGFCRFFPIAIVAYFFAHKEQSDYLYSKSTFFGLTSKIFCLSIASGFLLFIQVFLFHFGSNYTSKNYVALLAFSFPLYTPFFASYVLSTEKKSFKKIIGSLIAYLGIIIALYNVTTVPDQTKNSILFGNVIELLSAIMIAFFMSYTKKLIIESEGKKWSILCSQMVFSSILFLICALMTEKFSLLSLSKETFGVLIFQVFAIGVIGWCCFQYCLSKLAATTAISFYFIPPLFSQIIHSFPIFDKVDHEPLNPKLLFAGLLIAFGILTSNLQKH